MFGRLVLWKILDIPAVYAAFQKNDCEKRDKAMVF